MRRRLEGWQRAGGPRVGQVPAPRQARALLQKVAQGGRAERVLPPAPPGSECHVFKVESPSPPSRPPWRLWAGGLSPPANHACALPASDPAGPAEAPTARAIGQRTRRHMRTPRSPRPASLGLPAGQGQTPRPVHT